MKCALSSSSKFYSKTFAWPVHKNGAFSCRRLDALCQYFVNDNDFLPVVFKSMLCFLVCTFHHFLAYAIVYGLHAYVMQLALRCIVFALLTHVFINKLSRAAVQLQTSALFTFW